MRDANFTSGPFYLDAAGTFGTIPNDGMQQVTVSLGGEWEEAPIFVYGHSNMGKTRLMIPGIDDQDDGITEAGVYSIASGGFMFVSAEMTDGGTPSGTATLYMSSSPDIAGTVLGA